MKKIINLILLTSLIMYTSSCSSSGNTNKNEKGTFGYDVQFLKDHTDVVVLKDNSTGGSVLVTPKMQGRVMTSTLGGDSGKSLGWVNHQLIESGKIKEHFTPYGGEDRFWIGPEGGQFSVFLKPDKKMVFDNWYVPSGFNTEPWNLVSETDSKVTVGKELNLTNYSKTKFNLEVNRSIKLFGKSKVEEVLDIQLPKELQQVAFESENTIKNTGQQPWTKESGALSIWVLSQFNPAQGITVAIPYKQGSKDKLGPIVTTDYFGEISDERLKVDEGVIYFKMDGKKRRKLGLSPERSLGIEASYDETNQILTIMKYNQPKNNTNYMNQLWTQQEHPYNGSAEFAYNDGPLEDGSQLGPFYEMESSSPAAFLKPDESLTHNHQIFHFSGKEKKLNKIAERLLGISLDNIKSAFKE